MDISGTPTQESVETLIHLGNEAYMNYMNFAATMTQDPDRESPAFLNKVQTLYTGLTKWLLVAQETELKVTKEFGEDVKGLKELREYIIEATEFFKKDEA